MGQSDRAKIIAGSAAIGSRISYLNNAVYSPNIAHCQVVHARRVTNTVSTGVVVQLEQVRRVFNDRQVVIAGMDLRIDSGEFLAVLGPSGCGKSTLLRMIARLAEPDSGRIRIEPNDARFQTAFVFQDANLLPWRNVLNNAALPLELMGESKAKREEKARAVLDQVGLLDALDRYPAQLSGGMRMRVSMARALVTEPRLLLLDEPFAALDEITRFHLDVQLRELWRRRGMTVIFVTHSVSEAAFLANRAVVMGRGGGAIRLDRTLQLPAVRDYELRGDPRLGQEMRLLLGAIEE
jgi:NitT/TauT family transport system ATP-binding protein